MDAALSGDLDSFLLAVDLHSSKSFPADWLAIVLESVCSTSIPSLMKTTVPRFDAEDVKGRLSLPSPPHYK